MWRLLLVSLAAAALCKESSAACGPVEEGQTTSLTCTVATVECASSTLTLVLRWQAPGVSSTFVTQCAKNVCGGALNNSLPTTISKNTSTLTINSVSRTSPLNMETQWTCIGLCNGQVKTVCSKLVVYALPENANCTMREDTLSGDIKSVTVTCSTTKVYPRAKCSFERITDGGSPVTISQTPTYTHPPTAGTSAVYYMSGCSVTVPVSNLGEGTHSFQGYIYPDVAGGRNLVDVTTAPGTVNLTLPQASLTCSPQMTRGYFYGKSANCTCSLQSGYPRGRAQWYRRNQIVSGLSDGVLDLTFNSSNPKEIYTCKGLSDIGQGQELTVTAKFAFFNQTSVHVQPSTPSVDLCGQTNDTVTVTCRVSEENVNPAPIFSFSLDGLVFDTPQVGSLNNGYYQHLFSLSPDGGGVYNVTCRVNNTVSGETQQEETSVTYIVPPISPPQITIKDQAYEGTNPPNTVTLAAGYTEDVTCRVEGGYPSATITRLTCGSLEGSATDNVATLTFKNNTLTKDMDGSVCTCTGQHVSGCYSNNETTLSLGVAFFDLASVDVQPSTPSVDLCGQTNDTVTVTCRVSEENVNPAPTFSFSLDGLVFDTPQVGSLNNGSYHHLFSLSPDDGGVYNVTCRVNNTVTGETQQEETSVTYSVPPISPPQITIKDQTYEGTSPPNTVTLAAGYTGDVTCRVEGGYPSATITRLTCGSLEGSATDNVATLTFQTDPLTKDMDGYVCTCTGQHVSGCYSNNETTLSLGVAFFDPASVDVQPSTPSVDLCGQTNNPVIVTCRVSEENVYPAPTFSFSLDGLVFDAPQVGSLNNGYYQHLFSLSPDDGGVYTVTCRVTNTVAGETQQKETSVLFTEPPTSPPQVTINGQSSLGTDHSNSVTLPAGYTGDATCSVAGGYPSATSTTLTCGSLTGPGPDNVATLTFTSYPLTRDMDGTVCTCSGEHASGCYHNNQTTLTLVIVYVPVLTFTLDPASLVFSEGATPTFTCSVNGNPPPSVSLVRQRTQQQLASGQENLKTTELTHTMDPLGCLDTDVYVCSGQNSRGTIEEEISVRVECPQQLKKNSTVDPAVNGRLNGMAKLSLEIYGYPEPNAFTLMRITDRTNLARSPRHDVSYSPSLPPFGIVEVTISDLVKEDYTDYTITVDNGKGEALLYYFYLRQLDETIDSPATTLSGLQDGGSPDTEEDESGVDGDLVTIIIGVIAAAIFAAFVVVILFLVRRINSLNKTVKNSSEQQRISTEMRVMTKSNDEYLKPVTATTGRVRSSSLSELNLYEELPDRLSAFRPYSSISGRSTGRPTFYNTLLPVPATTSSATNTTLSSSYIPMEPAATTTSNTATAYNNTMPRASATASNSGTEYDTPMSPASTTTSNSGTTYNNTMPSASATTSSIGTPYVTPMSLASTTTSNTDTTYDTPMSLASTTTSNSGTPYATPMPPASTATSDTGTLYDTPMSLASTTTSNSGTPYATPMPPASTATSNTGTLYDTPMSLASTTTSNSGTPYATPMPPASTATSDTGALYDTPMSLASTTTSNSGTPYATPMPPASTATSDTGTLYDTPMSQASTTTSNTVTTYDTPMSLVSTTTS